MLRGTENVVCCVLLGGLMLFGPRGLRLFRALRGAQPPRAAHRPLEVTMSRHLLVASGPGHRHPEPLG
jgi:hypothetical protein